MEHGESDRCTWTYGELDAQARRIAQLLRRSASPGDRVLLAFVPGLEYVAAFYGCLYAGVVAVPTYMARLNRSSSKLRSVLLDCKPAAALTKERTLQELPPSLADGAGLTRPLEWLPIEAAADFDEENWRPPHSNQDSVAFLQYTSGSTSTPRGVMVSHGNLLHNLSVIADKFGAHAKSKGVIWLPPYHDMGLIGGILQPIFMGFPVALMPPLAFIQRPYRWLKAISDFGATISGGPNFAYDLCVERVTPDQKRTLDLSSWEVAFNGAEPIRPETLDRFCEAFASCGFRRESFYPCYGLAESTLIVAGARRAEGPVVRTFKLDSVERGAPVDANGDGVGRRMVSSGEPGDGIRVAIVDPQTRREMPDERVGEIWVSGPSVARGYWGREIESAEAMRATIPGREETYLRTGDLGFVSGGELFVTGRQKDLIIVRGVNHYPQDVENTATESHEALKGGRGAAFAVEGQGGERLVVVHEIVDRHLSNFDEIFASITRAVAEEHDLQPSEIVLVGHHRVPKTSSGKIQRRLCRRQFESGELTGVLATWRAPSVRGDSRSGGAAEASKEGSPEAAEPSSAVPWENVEFLKLVLDTEYLADSAALWDGEVTLAAAQEKKLRRILELAGLPPNGSILDVGCGWGGLLRFATGRARAGRAVGLTNRSAEAEYIRAVGGGRIEAVESDWRRFRPSERFDSVACVGAIEHFVPLAARARGVQVDQYRRFFRWCRRLMNGRGGLAVQTLVALRRADNPRAYQDVSVLARMFPQSSIPAREELIAAASGLFEVVESASIRRDYEKTLESWLRNLHERRDEILERFGAAAFDQFDRYLEASLRQATGGYVDAVQWGLAPLPTSDDAWEDDDDAPQWAPGPAERGAVQRSRDEIQEWIVAAIAARLRVQPDEVDVRRPFSEFGLDSLAMVGLVGELETWLDRPLSPTLAWDYPSIEALSAHLAEAPTRKLAPTEPKSAAEPIAIVGMACRFPGARGLRDYWRLMIDRVNAVRETPKDRWDVDEYFDPDPDAPGKVVTRWGGFVDDVDQFDPQFFGISPREAARMDPQQRMLLETSWEALESAGLPADRVAGTRTGVFIGVGGTDYSQIYRRFENSTEYLDPYSGTGNALSIAANRISYILDLHGPSLAVDTACSSALVAIHYACQSLRNRECDLALAGGVNAILTPEVTIAFSKARMLSPDGSCKTFDADANGYVRGEGCGVLLFKRLEDAVRDGDEILAVVRGSAVNQDGKTTGITAPSGPSQTACVQEALGQAGLTADALTYIEAHGTGTALGDPIEVQALRAVLGERRPGRPECYIGSIKPNIGHLETASGAAGLIRVVLMMQHGVIPPQRNFRRLNPHIKLDGSPIQIATQPVAWTGVGDGRLVAGVSGFGFGGTNAHLVVENFRPAPSPVRSSPEAPDRPIHLTPISAQSEAALKEYAARCLAFLDETPDASVGDVAYSAGVTRTAFDWRMVVPAASRQELRDRLGSFLRDGRAPGVAVGAVKTRGKPRIAFLFTGQGAQYPGMAKALYETQPTFRRLLDRCQEILAPHLELPLLEVMFNPSLAHRIDETAYTQPALFAVEYAIAELWRSWGVEASFVHGHSVGEYAAACYAGVMSLEDGLRLIAERARRMQALPAGGKMAVVFAPEDVVREAVEGFGDSLSIATINGPENTVISGAGDAVAEAVARFEEKGVRTQGLAVSHAFHSSLLEPMLDGFHRWADRIEYRPPSIPLISNLTGRFFPEGAGPNGKYWRDHARGAVRFAEGMRALAEARCDVFLEVGPHPSLVAMGRRCLPNGKALWTASLRKGAADWDVLGAAVASLYVYGLKIDWRGWDRDYARRRVSTPGYPFQRKRYWMDEDPERRSGAALGAKRCGPPLLGAKLPLAVSHGVYSNELHLRSIASLKDHVVQGSIVLPGAAYVESALEAAEASFGEGGGQVENLTFQHALFLAEKRRCAVQVVVSPEVAGASSFSFMSCTEPDSPWTLHASGVLRRLLLYGEESPRREIPHEIREECDLEHSREEFYAKLAARGLEYGPLFQPTERIWRRGKETLARMALPDGLVSELGRFRMHPAVLDGCLHALGAAIPEGYVAAGTGETYLPTGVSRVRRFGDAAPVMWVHARMDTDFEAEGLQHARGDVWLMDENGDVLVELEGVTLTRIGVGRRDATGPAAEEFIYETEWKELAADLAVAAPAGSKWLVASDGSKLQEALKAALEAAGAEALLLAYDASFSNAIAGGAWTHVVFLCEGGDGERPGAVAADRCKALLKLVQAMDASVRPPRLVIATVGAQVAGEGRPVGLAGAELWGFGRTIANERPEWKVKLLDLDPVQPSADALVREATALDDEGEVALRDGKRFGLRLVRWTERGSREDATDALRRGTPIPRGAAYRLEVGDTPTMDRLAYRPFVRRRPGPGEVEVEVAATGLNFSDVLKSMGLYPGLKPGPVPIGVEFSGVVRAIGDDVHDFAEGDEVMGVAPFSFASHATTSRLGVAHKPARLSHEEAATIPIAFLTAYYALCELARVVEGERVLIHAAAGGVGLAAVQICQAVGAEIFATAGSDEKRDFLRSLGVEHVMNSRSLEFADEIARITDGRGVDVVLNSLPGEAISKSIESLGAYGRFLEIGKTDIYQNRAIGLFPFQNNLSYFAIDLDKMLREKPELVRRMFLEVVAQLEKGVYRPLPMTVFDREQTSQAFRYMAQRKNTGKVIVRGGDASGAATPGAACGASTYWITGGMGALGLETAKHLADRGASRLVLFGRSEPSGSARAAIEALEARGVCVAVARADVANRAELERAIRSLPDEMSRPTGVYHAAGVLDDGVVGQQSPERFEKVMGPKAEGAWNLHEATSGLPVTEFVMFSSVASVLGSPGQSNYAAANAFLDGLAAYRRARGLPALSINWGPWADVGMAARMGEEKLAGRGVRPTAPDQAIEGMRRLIEADATQAAVIDADWETVVGLYPAGPPALLKELAAAPEKRSRGDQELRQRVAATPPDQRRAMLQAYFLEQIARVMELEADRIDPDQPMNTLGLDSLMAIELKNGIESSLSISLPMAKFLEGPSASQLAEMVVDLLAAGETARPAESEAAATAT